VGTISRSFSWSEFEATSHAAELARKGVRNVIPSFEVRDSVLALVRKVLQPLRDIYQKPMKVNSGYRCPVLNEIVGGVPSSQHVKGEAADIHTGSPLETFRLAHLAKSTPEIWAEIDQLICYDTFLHISHKRVGTQRHQLLFNKSYRGRRVGI
jgi:hypothetical protein